MSGDQALERITLVPIQRQGSRENSREVMSKDKALEYRDWSSRLEVMSGDRALEYGVLEKGYEWRSSFRESKAGTNKNCKPNTTYRTKKKKKKT